MACWSSNINQEDQEEWCSVWSVSLLIENIREFKPH